MKELTKEILEFAHERDWEQFHTPENIAKSIAIESGELLECFQWNNNFNIDEVKEELADVMNYCLILSSKLDLDVETIIKEKLEKNREKYPVHKAKGSSLKYDKL